MLTSDQVDSVFFRRLTGKLSPKLVHPTNSEFDLSEWQRITAEDRVGERDEVLARTAHLIGLQMHVLRGQYLDGIFGSLGHESIVRLAVANANHMWANLRSAVHRQMEQEAAKNEVGYFAAVGKAGLPIGYEGGTVDPDDANTAIIDTLPHWFAAAAQADTADDGSDPPEVGTFLRKAQFGFNLEHAFRTVWQEVLWEPWGFEDDKQGARLFPLIPPDMSRWKAWDWREQVLTGQTPLLERNLERGLADLAKPLPLTAGIDGNGNLVPVVPTDEQSADHRTAFEALERSYLAIFLDQELEAASGLTPRLLERATCVLHDLADLLMPPEAVEDELKSSDVSTFLCSVRREQLVALLTNALEIEAGLAEACVKTLSAEPLNDLGSLFKTGLWHRPLVSSPSTGDIFIVLGALMWGSSVRRVERWLQGTGTEDLSRTSNGLRFEAAYREQLNQALAENSVLKGGSSAVISIGARQAAEEIDLLFRIGSTVVVGELKCLLGPSEPDERYNYVRKLEKACAQASRKAKWLAAHPEEITKRVGGEGKQLRVVPLVVVNQSNGAEWSYEDCMVTDSRFLELFLSGGSMLSGARLFLQNIKAPQLATRRLYVDLAGAEAAIPDVFRAIAGMDPFRDSIAWDETVIPLADGKTLRMGHPMPDIPAYQKRAQLPQGG